VQVPRDEGVAIHIGPESCAVAREGLGEALTGVRIGQVRAEIVLLAADGMNNCAIAATLGVIMAR
jgi:hypothetical protein